MVSGSVHGAARAELFHGPEIFEPVIGTITAGRRCELEFKRNRPKALSSLYTASWELPQAAEDLPLFSGRACQRCNVMQMAGAFPPLFLEAAQVCVLGTPEPAQP